MAENNFEKTEAPTQRRRDEARKDGNIAKSQDLTAALALLAAVVLLYVMGQRLFMGMAITTETVLSGRIERNPTRIDDVEHLFAFIGRMTIEAALPFVICISAVALLANLLQVGFLLTGKPLIPKFSKLNPLTGVKRLLDMRAMMRFVMSLLKLAILAGVSMWVIHMDLPRIAAISQLEVRPLFAASAGLVFALSLKLAIMLLIIAILDYSFQKWKHEQDLKMSKHEVKEEMKDMEGDPLVRQRRQRVARQLAMQRIGSAVPKADVIVTNPTHFAIALRYRSDEMHAPKVVAKGADFLAMHIRQLAMQHNIPIIERKELARALYQSVEVGQEVPPEHYNAVAEILAYVYRLSRRSA